MAVGRKMQHVNFILFLYTAFHSTSTAENQVCKVGNAATEDLCDNGRQFCHSKACKADSSEVCLTIYKRHPDQTDIKPIYGSCWGVTNENCHEGKCVLEYRDGFNMYDCCCTGHLCNANIIFPTGEALTNGKSENGTETFLLEKTKSKQRGKYYLYYVPASIVLSIMLTGVALYFWVKRKRHRSDSDSLLSDFSTTTKPSTLPAVMLQVIHEGQMSVIWKGSYCQRNVAIKVINKHNYNSWSTEKDLFANNNLRHENLVNFICAEKRYHENSIQHWIVTEFHDNGSLADYLYIYALTKNTFLKMLYSIIKGLVYLHSNDTSSGKPMIAHRDLKPANVLVKHDLSCCISDLGLAISLPEHIKVSRDLCQAGTNRYMAPEILQGAVTFHQESFLRADMYSMGLVMWELFSRTKLDDDIDEIGAYQPPYADFVNFNPSVDEMLKCVVENKERPYIKPEWKQTQALSNLTDTMERCWDDDSDARLTSHCVEHRIKNLIHSPPDLCTFEPLFLEQLKDELEEDSISSSTSSCHSALITKDWHSQIEKFSSTISLDSDDKNILTVAMV